VYGEPVRAGAFAAIASLCLPALLREAQVILPLTVNFPLLFSLFDLLLEKSGPFGVVITLSVSGLELTIRHCFEFFPRIRLSSKRPFSVSDRFRCGILSVPPDGVVQPQVPMAAVRVESSSALEILRAGFRWSGPGKVDQTLLGRPLQTGYFWITATASPRKISSLLLMSFIAARQRPV
jgi:hypothetical protein